MPADVGPGSYNSNPFKNIEATVNASHHVVSFLIIPTFYNSLDTPLLESQKKIKTKPSLLSTVL